MKKALALVTLLLGVSMSTYADDAASTDAAQTPAATNDMKATPADGKIAPADGKAAPSSDDKAAPSSDDKAAPSSDDSTGSDS